MAGKWTEVDVILTEGGNEEAVAVYERDGLVKLHVNNSDNHEGAEITMGPEVRAWFQRAFMEAERRAEATGEAVP